MRASDELEKLKDQQTVDCSVQLESSVHFDHTVDLPREPETGEKSNGSCEQKEAKDHDTCVTEVQECRSAPGYLQLGDEIVNTINGEVESREATCKEASPPPVVILCTKMKVAKENRGLGAGNDKNDKHQEQKSVHVVDLGGPD